LVSGLLLALLTLLLFHVLLPLLSRDVKEIFNNNPLVFWLFIWLFVICLGGYVAARRGKTTGWTNSLVVGLLAELYVASQLLQGTSLLEMMEEAGPNWARLTALALTIPAAVVGGILWEESSKRQPHGDDQSEAASPAED